MPPTTTNMDSPLAGKQSVPQERSPLRYQELLSPEKVKSPIDKWRKILYDVFN